MGSGSQSLIWHRISTIAKIQDGGGRHFEISQTAMTRPFLNRHQIWHRDRKWGVHRSIPTDFVPTKLLWSNVTNHIPNPIPKTLILSLSFVGIASVGIVSTSRKWGSVSDYISKIDIPQNPRWRPSLFWNQLNGDNSANIEQIFTKFNTETGNQVLQLALPSKFR